MIKIRSKNVFLASNIGRSRASLLVRNELNVLILPNFSNEDIVSVSLEDGAGKLGLLSAYMTYDDEVEPPPDLLRKTLAEARRRIACVIIGSDANSIFGRYIFRFFFFSLSLGGVYCASIP